MSSPEPIPDPELIERCRSGDADAFAELIRPWQRRLAGYLTRMCGNASHADDLRQETLIRVWRGLRAYDDRTRFGSWLFTIAHHVAIDHLRRQDRWPDEVEVPPLPAPDDPSAEFMARELGKLLEDAVANLPEKQRRVFLLRQHGTLKFREIAELTGEPLSTVLGHMSYATEKLQRIVRQFHAR